LYLGTSIFFLHDALPFANSITTRVSRTWNNHGTEQVGPPRTPAGHHFLSDGHDPPLPRLAATPGRVCGAGLQNEEARFPNGEGSRHRPNYTRWGSCFIPPQTRRSLNDSLSLPGLSNSTNLFAASKKGSNRGADLSTIMKRTEKSSPSTSVITTCSPRVTQRVRTP